jgi:hypothetical protein
MKPQQKGAPIMTWQLGAVIGALADQVEHELRIARQTIGHGSTLGEASQQVWIRLFDTYLPARYCSRTAIVMDSFGKFSDEIDVVIFDRQYSPLLFQFQGATVVPIEAVYAVFESKQELMGQPLDYALEKMASVRRLRRTSVTVPTINGSFRKTPQPILGGFLALDALSPSSLNRLLVKHLDENQGLRRLDFVCIASLGTYGCGRNPDVGKIERSPATSFLFELMSRLQARGTAPAIDFCAYARWIGPGKPAPKRTPDKSPRPTPRKTSP